MARVTRTWSLIITSKVKVKLSLCFYWAPRHESILGEWMYNSTHSLTWALDGGEWSASQSGRFIPRERAPGTHWIGGWVGPRAVLDSVVKRKIPSTHRELNPRTPIIQPVDQSYTDWAIMAPLIIKWCDILCTRIYVYDYMHKNSVSFTGNRMLRSELWIM
jgi:hypothetical protein